MTVSTHLKSLITWEWEQVNGSYSLKGPSNRSGYMGGGGEHLQWYVTFIVTCARVHDKCSLIVVPDTKPVLYFNHLTLTAQRVLYQGLAAKVKCVYESQDKILTSLLHRHKRMFQQFNQQLPSARRLP